MSLRFPYTRPRRIRQKAWSRNLCAEHRLAPSDLILPLFIKEGLNLAEAVQNMPDIYVYSPDQAVLQAQRAADMGIQAVMLFPQIEMKLKDPEGQEALNSENLVCRTVRAIKTKVPTLGVIADVALDAYTSHGHDGILGTQGQILNDATVDLLARQALVLAAAGVDAVAPSDMMDGRIQQIRKALEQSSFFDTQIIAYAAKYASPLFKPYRSAVGSAANLASSSLQDKRSYQMDYANAHEALLESQLDAEEGADMLIVKPGLPYLDIIYRLSQALPLPILGFQVSGEYAMLKLAAAAGALDFTAAAHEALLGFKRAGARAIISYAALEVAESMRAAT